MAAKAKTAGNKALARKREGSEILAKREELEQFCKTELKLGRHFGTVHRKTCRTPKVQEWTPCASCGSKPSLYQPGAERICEYRKVLIGEPKLDRDIVEVAGGSGWVAFRITLTYRENSEVLSHGVGAYKSNDPNVMVKKAKKNAVIDATRTGFALSDLFDDADHDDPTVEELQSSADTDPKPKPPARPASAPPPAARAAGGRDMSARAEDRAAGRDVQAHDDPPAPSSGSGLEAPNPASGKPAPPWWEVRAEYPKARWTVMDRDDREYTIMGVIHALPTAKPMLGGGSRQWSPFTPNSEGRPEFKTKEPFLTWAQMDWYQLLEWAIAHRLKRENEDETNHFNDPFHNLLADQYVCVYNGAVLPIAEHAAAMDWIAWGIVKKKDGVVPSWVLDAMNNDEPAPAPAEPGSDFSLDDEESF